MIILDRARGELMRSFEIQVSATDNDIDQADRVRALAAQYSSVEPEFDRQKDMISAQIPNEYATNFEIALLHPETDF